MPGEAKGLGEPGLLWAERIPCTTQKNLRWTSSPELSDASKGGWRPGMPPAHHHHPCCTHVPCASKMDTRFRLRSAT